MQLQDGSLDALALVEGLLDSNPVNWNHVLDVADKRFLLYGMTDLAKSLLLALAAARGEEWRATSDRQRHVILTRDREAS